MNIEKTEKEDFISSIKVTLSPADYLPKFDEKLKSLQKNVNMKGFRKGKTPQALIKKMYGSHAFSEILDELFNKNLISYFQEKKISYIAQPLMTEGQEQVAVDHTDRGKEYHVSFDINEVKDVVVAGYETKSFDYYVPVIEDSLVDDEMNHIATQNGEMVEADTIGDNDNFDVLAQEMEGNDVKEGGFENTIKLFSFSIADQELKSKVVGMKKGDSFISELQKIEDKDKDFLTKNLLKINPEDGLEVGDVFKFTIEKINHLQPATIDDEFVKEKLTNLGVETVQDARQKIKESIGEYYENSSKNMLYRQVMEEMMDKTNINVSETFVKRWLTETEKLSAEEVEKQYKALIGELKWTEIKSQLSEKFDVNVSQDEIKQGIYQKVLDIQRQYQIFDQGITQRIVERISSDKNEIYSITENIRSQKIFDALDSSIKRDIKSVTLEEFQAKITEINNSIQE